MNNPSFVFIHGAGMSGDVWRSLASALAGDFLFLDLPAHGRAPGPALETIEAMADFASRPLGKYSRPVLVGHSMGALVALAVAGRVLENIAGLVLIGANASMPVNPQLLQTARDTPDAAAGMILKWGIAKTAQPCVREGLEKLMLPSPAGVLAHDLAACDKWQSTAAIAEKIKVPVLVIAGADDKMTPAAKAVELASMFAGGKAVVLPALGHMAMVENPEETARQILDFFGINRT